MTIDRLDVRDWANLFLGLALLIFLAFCYATRDKRHYK